MSKIINIEMQHHPTLMDIARKVYDCYKSGASEVRINMEYAKEKQDINTGISEKAAELHDLRQRYKNFFGVEL